jgi:hypothetical protein
VRDAGEEGEQGRRFVLYAYDLESREEDELPVIVMLIQHFMLIPMVEKQQKRLKKKWKRWTY